MARRCYHLPPLPDEAAGDDVPAMLDPEPASPPLASAMVTYAYATLLRVSCASSGAKKKSQAHRWCLMHMRTYGQLTMMHMRIYGQLTKDMMLLYTNGCRVAFTFCRFPHRRRRRRRPPSPPALFPFLFRLFLLLRLLLFFLSPARSGQTGAMLFSRRRTA